MPERRSDSTGENVPQAPQSANRRLRDARVTLVQGMRQVVRNGLGLLGVSAPEAM